MRSRLETTRAPATTGSPSRSDHLDRRAEPGDDARLAGGDDAVDADDLPGLDDDRLARTHVAEGTSADVSPWMARTRTSSARSIAVRAACTLARPRETVVSTAMAAAHARPARTTIAVARGSDTAAPRTPPQPRGGGQRTTSRCGSDDCVRCAARGARAPPRSRRQRGRAGSATGASSPSAGTKTPAMIPTPSMASVAPSESVGRRSEAAGARPRRDRASASSGGPPRSGAASTSPASRATGCRLVRRRSSSTATEGSVGRAETGADGSATSPMPFVACRSRRCAWSRAAPRRGTPPRIARASWKVPAGGRLQGDLGRARRGHVLLLRPPVRAQVLPLAGGVAEVAKAATSSTATCPARSGSTPCPQPGHRAPPATTRRLRRNLGSGRSACEVAHCRLRCPCCQAARRPWRRLLKARSGGLEAPRVPEARPGWSGARARPPRARPPRRRAAARSEGRARPRP